MLFFSSDLIGHGGIARILASQIEHLAPAYLFSGAPQLGKRTFAERFIQGVLEEGAEPLGAQAWRSHPDVIVLDVQEGKKQISLEQIHGLRTRVFLRPLRAPRVVAYLPHADRLHEAGANALLKILEEPPAGALFLLVAEDVGRFPATVLSRVVHVPFSFVPTREIAEHLLRRGVSEDEALLRARSARGRPGLAIAPDQESRVAHGIESVMAAKTLGARLRSIEEMTKLCESAENPEEAWRLVLAPSSASLNLGTAEGVLFGTALLAAQRCIGSPVSPRLALEAAAIRMSGGSVREEARRLAPTHLPRTMPLVFQDLLYS